MRLLTWPVACLAALTLCAGCAGSETPTGAGSASASPTTSDSGGDAPDQQPAEVDPADTFADVAAPATLEVPTKVIDGVESVRFWDGAAIEEGPTQVYGELVLDDGDEVLVTVFSRDGALAKETSREELDYWIESNSFTEGRAREVDPVVVDGEEMLRAQGRNGFAEIDYFVRATGDLTVWVMFLLPDDMSAADRERWVGEVMATLTFS